MLLPAPIPPCIPELWILPEDFFLHHIKPCSQFVLEISLSENIPFHSTCFQTLPRHRLFDLFLELRLFFLNRVLLT